MTPIGDDTTYDAVVVGGGPAGATAACDLARRGRSVLLLDRAGRVKPCGGAIPPRLIADFEIPDHLLVARARSARMVSPNDVRVDIPIENGFVGMVDRDAFDEWLRERARLAGAVRRAGTFERFGRDADGCTRVHFLARERQRKGDAVPASVRARSVVGADGARSAVAREAQVPGREKTSHVFAYHEIVRRPAVPPPGYDGSRCDVVYRGTLSPDFYGWVFPHGETLSIGTGSAEGGFSLRHATAALRADAGLAGAETLRREGAPIPMRPLPRWDDGRDVVLAGDAAGVVAPASGEGIYYAMAGGRFAADAVDAFLASGDARALAQARKRFMREHGRVFWVLGMMQRFWYSSDKRRERFVAICRDKDVQQLTFDAYMNKRLVRKRPLAHARIFMKDMAHLLGLARGLSRDLRARGSIWKPIAFAALAAIALAVLGGLSTDIGPWYRSLRQPAWKPPDAWFGPIWTTIYSLAAIAAVLGWRRARSRHEREWMLGFFAGNAFFNVLWSLLFFRLRRPDWALAEVVFLWLSIVVLIVWLWRFSKPSAWLLAPYLAWVSLAAYLNYEVVRLNGPFSG